ncbi:hypothetical protein V8E53_010694 [Lactarius tabidus]
MDPSEESILARLRHNALSPISSLPPEVFAAIFSLLCLPGASSPGGGPDHHIARLLVSHVCHQWREMALNQPLLWSHVDFTTLSAAGAAEILNRAKSVPLHLDASVFGRQWDKIRFSTFQKEVQTRVPYIRHLRTSAEPAQLHSTLEGLVSPAPTLEYLSLSSHSTRPDERGILERMSISDTLFDGSTPRLSWLELRNCGISWNSPLFKGLKYLEIFTPSPHERPKLTVWLDALEEISQLKALTLHKASPIPPPFPSDVERTVSLPSLTRLDILGTPGDCTLALAHFDLPALTCLCVTALDCHLPSENHVQNLLPYIARHSRGPQDAQPLQSVLIRTGENHADILAWSVPDFDAEVHNPPTLLAATVSTRVALSFRSDSWAAFHERMETLDMVMSCLPLEGLVTLAAHDLYPSRQEGDFPTWRFWSHLSPKWTLLERVRLGPVAARGFIVMLLQDKGEREGSLLPSLTELVMVDFSSYPISSLPLCNVFMKRVEQGFPLEMLDLRMCDAPNVRLEDWLRSLSEIVVDVLGPEKNLHAKKQIQVMWETVARGPFRVVDNEENYSATGLDVEELMATEIEDSLRWKRFFQFLSGETDNVEEADNNGDALLDSPD